MLGMIITTSQEWEVIDITDEIARTIDVETGACLAAVQHTTAALTTADLDPGTDQDLLDFLRAITPEVQWRHPHNPAHTPAHLLSSVVGPSVSVPVEGGQLSLGTWQRIILVELDGPRQREVSVTGMNG